MYPDSTELMHFCCSEHLAKYSVETASQHLQAQTVQHGALFQTTRQRQQERQKRPEKRTGRTEGEKTTHQEEKQNREKTERKRRQEKKEEGKEGEEEAEGRGEGEKAGEEGEAKGGRREGKKEEEEEEEKKKKAKKEEKGGEGRREERRREKRREAKKRKKRENKGDRLEPLNPSVPGRRKPNSWAHLISVDVWQWRHQRLLEYDASKCGTIPGLLMDPSASEKVPWHVRHLGHRQVLDMAAAGQPYCIVLTWTRWLWRTESVRTTRTWLRNQCKQRSKVF